MLAQWSSLLSKRQDMQNSGQHATCNKEGPSLETRLTGFLRYLAGFPNVRIAAPTQAQARHYSHSMSQLDALARLSSISSRIPDLGHGEPVHFRILGSWGLSGLRAWKRGTPRYGVEWAIEQHANLMDPASPLKRRTLSRLRTSATNRDDLAVPVLTRGGHCC